MPEGPEVWILSKMINNYYADDNTTSIGKHLIFKDIQEDWSFGLNGKVKINENNVLVKIETGWIYGEKKQYVKSIGLDWMTASKKELEEEVQKWTKSKKKLATLILDQSKICGIGVAWGSEILYKAKLNPDLKACDQSLDKLADSMFEICTQIQDTYINYHNENYDNNNLKELINDWFENLYKIRKMNIYKKGTKIQISGRSWWI
jgi:formamidopyrimidine-DNA glycosylase